MVSKVVLCMLYCKLYNIQSGTVCYTVLLLLLYFLHIPVLINFFYTTEGQGTKYSNLVYLVTVTFSTWFY